MHLPTPDNVTPGERAPAADQPSTAPVEREVRLDSRASRDDEIRSRLRTGFYHTPEVAEVVARRLIMLGDL